MPRLTSPVAELADHYEVVVVGSGYGAAITASRLARAGRQVCVLERGRERWPGEFPDTLWEAAGELQVNAPGGRHGDPAALVEVHANPEMHVVVGCGLGGTSLINANVSLRPDPRVWQQEAWPEPLRADVESGLADGFARAEAMLRPVPYPGGAEAPTKQVRLRQAAEGIGEGSAFSAPPLNVVFAEGPNAAGVHQPACTGCGDCVSGCNVGAKTTTLMTYLPDAWAHGAALFTEVAVRHLERRDGRWVVHLHVGGLGRERFGDDEPFVTADLVVLGAGSLGSTEILLRSAAEGLALSGQLGRRFTGNGDVLGFSYDGDDEVDGVGWGDRRRAEQVGPTITGMVDLRGTPGLTDGHVVEEGAIPGALASAAPALFAAGAAVAGETARPSFGGTLDRLVDTVTSLVGGSRRGAMDRTLTYLVMGHDDTEGRLELDDDRVRVSWRGAGAGAEFHEVDELLGHLAEPLGGRFVRDPLWSEALGESLITVHPLGGCPMGASAETGVVDHRHRVFRGAEGADTYESLYVIDGAVVPTSLGVNPLLTISALAERACALVCEERGWTADDALPARPLVLPEPDRVGLRFTETMHGQLDPVSDGFVLTDGAASFVITVEVDDADALLADPGRPGRVVGTLELPGLDDGPLAVAEGTFRLFVGDPDRVDTDRMEYRLPAVTADGRRFTLTGTKTIGPGSALGAWAATTTLEATLHEGGHDGPAVARGRLELGPRDLARQLRTMAVTGAPDRRTRVATLARFGALFAGELAEHYGSVLAPASVLDPDAPPRRRRELMAPVPEVREVVATDGVALRLTRFRGGPRGPVLVVHGAGVSSGIFTTDLPEVNLVESLVAEGFDVWLPDYRVSIALPAAHAGRPPTTSPATTIRHWWPQCARRPGPRRCRRWCTATARPRSSCRCSAATPPACARWSARRSPPTCAPAR